MKCKSEHAVLCTYGVFQNEVRELARMEMLGSQCRKIRVEGFGFILPEWKRWESMRMQR